MKLYVYFIVYKQLGSTNTQQCTHSKKIDSVDDIRAIEQVLEQRNGEGKVLVIDFKLLKIIEREGTNDNS